MQIVERMPVKKNIQAPNNEFVMQEVSFISGGLLIKGHLYKPDSRETSPRPTLIIGGTLTAVKEQMAGLYARHFVKKGYNCLAFDHRHFGESEGLPRFYESPERKISDFKNAISFLTTLPEVDSEKIGAIGICASAGYFARVAVDDPRLKAVAMVAPFLHDLKTIIRLYGDAQEIVNKIEQARFSKESFALTGIADYIPFSSMIGNSELLTDISNYFTDNKRGAIPEWKDQFAVMSWEDWLTFSPIEEAPHISQPVLIINSSQSSLSENVKPFFAQIASKYKSLRWVKGIQSGFYDNNEMVEDSVSEICRFFEPVFNSYS